MIGVVRSKDRSVMFLPTWLSEYPTLLNDVLSHINDASQSENPVDRSNRLFSALNLLWNTFARFRREEGQLTPTEERAGPSDAQASRQLVLGMSERQKDELVGSESVRLLSEFTPRIMNHDSLRRRSYDPANISESTRREASAEHRQLANAFTRWQGDRDNRSAREAVLKKLVVLLYVVRSNVAHGEKTVHGPDRAKADRDRTVATVANPAIEGLIEILLDKPNRRIAVYGTLAPGGANHERLSGFSGDWHWGAVRGEIEEVDELPVFRWREPGNPVPVIVLGSEDLPAELDALDRFEGPQYQRVLAPVTIEGRLAVCNIYEGAHLR